MQFSLGVSLLVLVLLAAMYAPPVTAEGELHRAFAMLERAELLHALEEGGLGVGGVGVDSVGARTLLSKAGVRPMASPLVLAAYRQLRPLFESDEHRDPNSPSTFTMLLKPGTTEGSNANSDYVPHNFTTATYSFKNSAGTSIGTLGDIVATAGDFFGAILHDQVICLADSDSRFATVFNQMYQSTDQDLFDSLHKYFDQEENALAATNLSVPGAAAAAYSTLSDSRYGLLAVQMVIAAIENLDHFGDCARTAYQTGHRIAMATARAAYAALNSTGGFSSQDLATRTARLTAARTQLEKAYLQDAFASHFLTDSLAAGHMRTPRAQIYDACEYLLFKLNYGGVSAGTVSKWMHDEDNRNGLWVANDLGDTWFAMGDKNFFDPRNINNLRMFRKALQTSRDEVWAAFDANAADAFGALSVLPNVTRTDLTFRLNNTCPLLRLSPTNSALQIRTPVNVARPAGWSTPGGAESCVYRDFTRDDCPSASIITLQTISGTLKLDKLTKVAGFLFGDTTTVYSDSQQAWVTTQSVGQFSAAPVRADASWLTVLLPLVVMLACRFTW